MPPNQYGTPQPQMPQQSVQPQPMQPGVYQQPVGPVPGPEGLPQPYAPANGLPAPGVQPVGPAEIQEETGESNRKKLIIVISSSVAVLIIITVAVVILAGSQSKTPKATGDTVQNQQTVGPSPATTLSTQQDSDAISQNLSSLDDTSDFPASALDDTVLVK